MKRALYKPPIRLPGSLGGAIQEQVFRGVTHGGPMEGYLTSPAVSEGSTTVNRGFR